MKRHGRALACQINVGRGYELMAVRMAKDIAAAWDLKAH